MAPRRTTGRKNGDGGAAAGQAAGGRLEPYIREKINQLLVVMGTRPLDMEMLDERSLLELDPIGTIACSFEQVLDHLKDTNKKLRVAKDQLQAVFDTAGVCISIIDPDLRVINCNEKQRELLAAGNKGDLRGRYCYEVYCGNDSPALACPAIETIETGRPVFIRELKKKGRYFQIVTSPLKDADGRLTAIIEVSVDVTEKKKAEEGRRQAEKLAALGLLGAGLAHEINNPLGNILGYSKMLLMEGGLTEKQKERLEIIAEQARKGSEIIKGLLDFSRQSRPAFEPVNLNELIQKSVSANSMLLQGRGARVDLKSADIPATKADPLQIGQVIDNLIRNAVHAMEGASAPLLTIETGLKGKEIEISMTDNGSGIPDSVVQKIFDPFFTTKPVGTGVGLGLSICAGIIHAHDGSIGVESEPGRGTRIYFSVPVRER
ncbi:MAG: two-component system sensor histidine kinase NtrB [Nitrospirota bacterium]